MPSRGRSHLTRPRLVRAFAIPEVAGSFAATLPPVAASESGTFAQVATQLAITTQPSGAVSGVALSTQPVVRLRDATNASVLEAGVTVTAYLASGSGTLGGTKQVVTDANGVATFTNLAFTGTGSFTIGFAALLSATQAIFADTVESDLSASYFEVDTAGGAFGRASVSGSQQWRSVVAATAAHNYGNLKLGFGTCPTTGSGFTSDFNPQGPTGVDFGLVTVEFDLVSSVANLSNSQDKCLRLSVFDSKDGSQAAVLHVWSGGQTYLSLDPVRGVSGTALLTSGWNDVANFVWLGIHNGATGIFGASATTSRRVKVVWKLNSPGQSDGACYLYYNDVLEAQATGLNFVDLYTAFGINACFWESYYNATVSTAHNRMFDNLSVTGQARALVSSSTVTVGAGGEGDPTPESTGGTILYDARAGGAQSWQAITTLAEVEAQSGITFFTDSGGSSWAFVTDYDGAGKHALRIDWPAAAGESFSQFLYYLPSAVHHLYLSVVIHLGRTATGGGNGAVGSYTPSGGTSVKQKVLYFYRNRDSATDRIYFHINDGADQQWGLLCDNLGIRDSWIMDYGVGQDVRYTFEFTPGSSFVGKVWRNGTLVKTSTAAFGSLNFNEIIVGGTRWANPVADSMYYTDLVLWTDD